MTDAARLLQELIRIPSVTGTSGEARAVEWLEARLLEKGIPSERVGATGRPNLVARLAGTDPSLPKLVLLSHLDVVPADESAWSHPPFGGVMDGGRLFGRGALDTKQLTVMELLALFRLRETGRAQRDVVLIATVDEEKGSAMGAGLMSKEVPELFRDAVALSEGGGFPLKVNGRDYLTITVGEKACCRIGLSASGQSGHAGAPGADQAVVKLAGAIGKVLEGVERLPQGGAVWEAMAGKIGKSPDNPLAQEFLKYSGNCGVSVPPFKIGAAVNVLPPDARIELEIRPLPGTEQTQIEGWLEDWLRDTGVRHEILWFQPGILCPPDGELFTRISRWVEELSAAGGFPSKALPMLALGRTDGRFFASGSRVFGFSPLGPEDAFDRILPMVHGADESVSLSGFEFGCRVFIDLVERLAGG
jgi:acetylornithine deacetylase/succinyl-diaminopimelate desuccinylase-like protein